MSLYPLGYLRLAKNAAAGKSAKDEDQTLTFLDSS